MFEQTFKNIDDILHKDAGCGSELDYVEQTSWVLFLKYLDDLEKDKATAAELTGKTYTPIIDAEFQWNNWAAPKKKKADSCLLYTSDAADERSSVDLGGRRIIKKKKNNNQTQRPIMTKKKKSNKKYI